MPRAHPNGQSIILPPRTVHANQICADKLAGIPKGATMSAISSANLAASSSNPAAASTQIRPAANASTPATSEQTTTTLKSDTVKLSLAASIALMHHQGMSASVIAAALGVSVKQVAGYIPGSTSSTAAATTVATAQTQQPVADTQKG